MLTLILAIPARSNAQTSQPRQVVRGRIIDQDAQIPLPGANVVLLGIDPIVGTITDADGWFVLDRVPLGRQDIRFSYIGYEALVLPGVLVTSGKEVVLLVELREQVFVGEEVVVEARVQKDQPLNEMAVVSARSFTVEETRRYAGGLDDPARMASAFAGVSTGGGIQENALIIRGNAPKGVLWRLEGVEIPNPSHFADLAVAGGGGLTLFSSQLLANSDFLTSAFPAEYGNALAGVFDISFRSGNPSKREHAAQVGLLGIDISSEGPFVLGRPSTYLFNYRYSTLALLLPILPTEDVARYQDLSFKLNFPTRKAGRFSFWGIGGLDYQTMSASSDSASWEYETWDRLDFDMDLAVGAGGISHDLILGNSAYLHSTAALTVNRTRIDQMRISDALTLEDDLFINSTNGRFIFSSVLHHKFSPRHVNQTGLTVQRLFYDFDLRSAPLHQPPLLPISTGEGTGNLLQLFTQSKLEISSGFSAHLGVHFQHFGLTDDSSIEPRVGLRWKFAPTRSFSLGYGLHSRIEDLRVYFVRNSDGARPNQKLGSSKAHHVALGYDQLIGTTSRLKLEAYYQYLFDVPVIADSSYSLLNFEQDWELNEALVNAGKGKNYGVEFTLERFLDDGYYYLLTGSVFTSTYLGGDAVWRNTRFDRGFTANFLFGREFSVGQDDLIGLNCRVIAMGGKRRLHVDTAASRAAEEVVYDEYQAFEEQDPTQLIFDFTVTYRRNHNRYSEIWALQIKNILGAKDVLYDYNFLSDTVERVEEGYPLPVLSYKIEF